MKAKLIFASMLALSLAACTNDDEPATLSDGKVAAQIVADIRNVATRASGTGWTKNDKIGISTETGTATDYTNTPYIWDGANFKADGTTIYFQDSQTVTFHAYYPYNAAGGVLTATTDADAQKNLPAIDFLYASGATAVKTEPTVHFTGDAAFCHRMSRITLTFEEGDDMSFPGKLTSYTLKNLYLKGEFNTENGMVQAVTAETTADLQIVLADVTATDRKYTAAPIILFPQDVADGRINLEVVVEGETYKTVLTLPDTDSDEDLDKDTALKSGYNYKYPVTVNKTGLTAGDAEILPWNEVAGGSTDAVM